MKKRIKNIFTAVLIMLLLTAFLAMTVVRRTGKESYRENRELAAFPEFTISALAAGSYTRQLGQYFTDHFAGRSYWMTAKGTADVMIGERIVNNVYVAEDMLLDVQQTEAVSWDDTALAVNEFASSYDGAVYFVAVPTSTGVYGERLPEHLVGHTEKQSIDSLYSLFTADIRKIDAYNVLKMLNENYIYYRNDTKWTSYGAYCVYRTVIQKLGFLPVSYDKYTIEHVTGDFRGNLYNKTLYTNIKADMLDIYNYSGSEELVSCTGYDNNGSSFEIPLYDKNAIDTSDMYKLYLGEDAPLVKIKTSINNNKKLLVIKDDYADCFIPFLTQHYSEIAVISPDCTEGRLEELVSTDEYAQTMFMFGIDSLCEGVNLEFLNK